MATVLGNCSRSHHLPLLDARLLSILAFARTSGAAVAFLYCALGQVVVGLHLPLCLLAWSHLLSDAFSGVCGFSTALFHLAS